MTAEAWGKGAVRPGGLLDFLGQTAWVLLPELGELLVINMLPDAYQ